MIRVSGDGEHLTLDIDGLQVTISKLEAYLLVRKLASKLNLRVTSGVIVTDYKVTGHHFVVNMIEGGKLKTYKIPRKVIESYLEVVNSATKKRYSHREFAEQGLWNAMMRNVIEARNFFRNGNFNWELLYGYRGLYYELYRVPLLLLEKRGIVHVKKQHVEIVKRGVSLKELARGT